MIYTKSQLLNMTDKEQCCALFNMFQSFGIGSEYRELIIWLDEVLDAKGYVHANDADKKKTYLDGMTEKVAKRLLIMDGVRYKEIANNL